MAVTVGFISLGCAKNVVDLQVMAGYLKASSVALAPAPEVADIIIVNTCAFIEAAREEAAEAILGACALKTRGTCRAVIVSGCMVQRYRARLKRAFPDVDAFLGIDAIEEIASVVDAVARGKRCGVIAARGEAVKVYNPPFPTLLFTGGPFAYLKVADGCDHRCAYCAIPLIRGRFRSRCMTDILQEAKQLLSAGVRELNVIAQDSLMYGRDRPGSAKILQLLKRLDALPGDFWIRILYGYPSELTDDVLHFIGQSKHICHYFDLPVQHAHPEILRAMNRAGAVDATRDLTARIRRAVPDATVRTTCLVGFPGETDEHAAYLLDYVRSAAFDHLGAFVFSPEEGTAADAMDETPPQDVAEKRARTLMRVQKTISAQRLASHIGETQRLLLLSKRGTTGVGRLASQAPEVDGVTRVTGLTATMRPGEFINVRLTGVRGFDFCAIWANCKSNGSVI